MDCTERGSTEGDGKVEGNIMTAYTGICLDCREPIAPKRIAALAPLKPLYCRECQERHPVPVEEAVERLGAALAVPAEMDGDQHRLGGDSEVRHVVF